MTKEHDERYKEALRALAADFVSAISNRQSLITITDVQLTDSHDKVTFYVSIFPETAEGVALGFLLRNRGECRAYLRSHGAFSRLPHVEFAIDEGEKRRRRVDELIG